LYINIDSNNYKLVTSGLVSTVFFFLVIGTPIFSRDKILLFLGSHTMAIYLLNTIVIGTIAAVGFAFIPEDSFRFEIILTLGAIAGTMLPIAFKMLLEKMPALGFIAKYFQ
ncbi:hypothetical protein, partial [Aliivibrio sp.]|uniref:hypothetical protein n=1 Tax=Aliivibrio sp. TaxID=1872443 RepID=UPI003D2F379C